MITLKQLGLMNCSWIAFCWLGQLSQKVTIDRVSCPFAPRERILAAKYMDGFEDKLDKLILNNLNY
jgi:hypothetical protein